MKIAFIFPGQGTQKVGMAADFYQSYGVARETFELADDVLRHSIKDMVFKGPESLLMGTRYSQIGIYVASMSILKTIQDQFPGLRPCYCAGLSLGEYSAATAAKKIDYQHCLPLVWARGNYMHEACEDTRGTMAALIGMSGDDVDLMVKELDMPEDLWVANYNAPGQVVLSGTLKGVEKGISAAKEAGARRAIPLQVHGAFHSGLMAKAEKRLLTDVREALFVDSKIKLFANVTGIEVTSVNGMKENLIKQVTHSVRWEQCIENITDAGVDLFVEIGPGKTLAAMNKRIKVEAPTISIESVGDLEKLAKIL